MRRLDQAERGALWAATVFVMAGLAILAYATWGLGIDVATCVPVSKTFVSPGVTQLGPHDYEVHYVARMWAFEPPELHVPPGSTLEIYAVSRDVTHGLEITGTNVNLMVVPGAVANARVQFNKPGSYQIVCHEFCGAGHQNMAARIEVGGQYTTVEAIGLTENAGAQLLAAKGCLACHSTDGSAGVGPTFKGAWGTSLKLADGSHKTLDLAFVQQKLAHPDQLVVEGYPPVMPNLNLKPQEIAQIAQYLEGLHP